MGTLVVLSCVRMPGTLLLFPALCQCAYLPSLKQRLVVWGDMVIFCDALSSNICNLNFPFRGLSWRVISGNRTIQVHRFFFKEGLSHQDIAHCRQNHECLFEDFSPNKKTKKYLFSYWYDNPFGNLEF